MRIEADGSLSAQRLVVFVDNQHEPHGLGLDDGEVVLPAAFAGNDRIAVPVIVAE